MLALSETASVLASCKRARLPRQTAYDWREADPNFAFLWDTALNRGTDALEDEAVRRATVGTDRPVFHGGKKVGSVRERSDTLLIFLLKGRRPEKYKERHEHAGPEGGPIPVEHAVQFFLPANGRPRPRRTTATALPAPDPPRTRLRRTSPQAQACA